jgi:hypothetical protein
MYAEFDRVRGGWDNSSLVSPLSYCCGQARSYPLLERSV